MASNSPGLVDFAYQASEFCFNLPDGQVMIFEEYSNKRTVKSASLLVEMTSVKMIFFAPCDYY